MGSSVAAGRSPDDVRLRLRTRLIASPTVYRRTSSAVSVSASRSVPLASRSAIHSASSRARGSAAAASASRRTPRPLSEGAERFGQRAAPDDAAFAEMPDGPAHTVEIAPELGGDAGEFAVGRRLVLQARRMRRARHSPGW